MEEAQNKKRLLATESYSEQKAWSRAERKCATSAVGYAAIKPDNAAGAVAKNRP